MTKRDQKETVFPLRVFLITFLVLALLTTGQMLILGQYVDYQNIARGYVVGVIIYWLVGAAGFTLLIGLQINRRLERPLMRFAEATEKVASGDFSVYVKPPHTADKMNYMDHMFLDFNRMVEQLGSIETLKIDFFSNVSHEIKTPISVIQNYAEILQREDLSEEKRVEYAQTIQAASKRLSELITNLLKLSKLEKQTITPKPETYDVCRQLGECVLAFESTWEQGGIELIADIEDAAVIMADESLMALVWNNLISNALKFTGPGGGITVRQVSTASEIIVTISDTGCGMDEETMKHIFEKFYQGDTSHSAEGNGLGLALVRRILQLSDGAIAVESAPGQGAVFTVTIPSYKGETADE